MIASETSLPETIALEMDHWVNIVDTITPTVHHGLVMPTDARIIYIAATLVTDAAAINRYAFGIRNCPTHDCARLHFLRALADPQILLETFPSGVNWDFENCRFNFIE